MASHTQGGSFRRAPPPPRTAAAPDATTADAVYRPARVDGDDDDVDDADDDDDGGDDGDDDDDGALHYLAFSSASGHLDMAWRSARRVSIRRPLT